MTQRSSPHPYTTLFRSAQLLELRLRCRRHSRPGGGGATRSVRDDRDELGLSWSLLPDLRAAGSGDAGGGLQASARRGADRKSTSMIYSHVANSYDIVCL